MKFPHTTINMLASSKSSDALRINAKPQIMEVNPNHNLYSLNFLTGEIKKVMKMRSAFLDWNKVYMEPGCEHCFAEDFEHAYRIFSAEKEKRETKQQQEA